MTQQEERDLLIKDLCGRLPYDIVISDEYGDYINVNIHNANIEHLIDRVVSGLDKMVLRPLSSMTDEEREELKALCDKDLSEFAGHLMNGHGLSRDGLYMFDKLRQLDWVNRNHFDFRCLIPKGLALEAKEGMYIN